MTCGAVRLSTPNSAFIDHKVHDIGTGGWFKTKTLLNAKLNAPYFHDGRYDTRVGSGKGHTGGAYRLRVRGFDDSVAKPTPLFDEWETPRDLPDAASTSDIEVTAESAPAGDDPATPFSPT